MTADTSADKGKSSGAPAPGASTRLSADLDAPRQARAFCAATLTEWRAPESLEEIALLAVSELVTNVVRHAGAECTVTVTHLDGGVRLAVRDWAGGRPEVQAPAPDGPNGRGLLVVAALASSWGVIDHADGKTVWCELAEPAPEPPSPDGDGSAAGGH